MSNSAGVEFIGGPLDGRLLTVLTGWDRKPHPVFVSHYPIIVNGESRGIGEVYYDLAVNPGVDGPLWRYRHRPERPPSA